MEATVVSIGKAVLEGALGYARSKAAEEVALQLSVEGDVAFIADELEMMQSFLMTADEEGKKNKVLNTWVKQVGDVAYNVEDSLMNFALYSEKKPSWWRSPRTMAERHRIAKEVKMLRAKVEDVSNRFLRYCPIMDRSATEEQANVASAAMLFGINEARFAAVEQEESKVDLRQLISSKEEDLRVIAVWGTTGDLGKTSVIQDVYDDPNVSSNFGFRAWIRMMHPFNPKQFIHSLVEQFYENCPEKLEKREKRKTIGVNVLMRMESMSQSEIIDVFDTQVSDNSYLIVIDDLSTIVEWHCIKKFFPDNKKRSRIIVSTQQVEVASLCTEKPYQVSEFKQLSSDQTLYLFHKKVISASGSAETIFDSNIINTIENTTMSTAEIQEQDQQSMNAGGDKVSNPIDRNKFHRSRTMALFDELSIGQKMEKYKVIELISQWEYERGCKVISVWGIDGLGKTNLVRSVYRSQQLSCWKRAWATALRPFKPEVLIRSLALQLLKDDIATGTARKITSEMNLQELEGELSRLLKTQKCLIVLDDISSTSEWELVRNYLANARRIIVTTREKHIAKHCSREDKNMYNLCGLKDDTALDLFKKKVFKDITGKIDLHPDMMEQARLILKKCDGLPLVISTIGGFLATKPATATEWRKMNDCISAELDVKTILMRIYDGLPYHLKFCFLYLSIFPEKYIIKRGRLVRRWTVEGYSRDMHGLTAEEVCHMYFDELLDRSMILPGEDVDHYSGEIGSCQLHDIMREICISKARKENHVFTLEEGCCLSNLQGQIRHLVISSNWRRDKDVFERMLDLSQVRSLTVFGEWRPYFISDNMRFLWVLDLEDTSGLEDDSLHKIGQLHHLKYLSVPRDDHGILYLPKSLRNCRHLQTLVAGAPSTLNADLCVAPRGIGKLQALHTLILVNVPEGKGNAIVKELGELTQLRKLAVRGVCEKNSKDFWSAIARHNQLRSLWVRGTDLGGCFGVDLSPPKFLESLVLRGNLVRATEWIHQLRNLSKLLLVDTKLGQNAAQALGMLPNLANLHMSDNSYVGRDLFFQSSSFPSLVVLHLSSLFFLEFVLFEGQMPKLELLQVDTCPKLKEISGLPVLTGLKEIRLSMYSISDEVKRGVRRQLAKHLKHVYLDTNFDGPEIEQSSYYTTMAVEESCLVM